MKLIPAIDLKNNKVVTAMQGKKRNYSEISKKLSPSSDPLAFIQYLLSIHHFNTIYLADLDSINLFNTKNSIINDIIVKYKHINFIVDNGLRHCSKINIYKAKNYQQIIGTETFSAKSMVAFRFKPCIIPSLAMSVKIIATTPDFAASLANS